MRTGYDNMLIVQPDHVEIRRIREAAGLTQVELAGLAGVSERTVRNAETGKRLQQHFLQYIAGALQVPLAEVLHKPAAVSATERKVERILQAWQVFVEHGDYGGFRELLLPTAEVIQAGPEELPFFGHFRGPHVEKMVHEVCIPLLEFRTAPPTLDTINAAQDFVCVSWVDSGLGAPNGQVAAPYHCLHVYEFERDRVTRMRSIGETQTILEAFKPTSAQQRARDAARDAEIRSEADRPVT